MLRLCSAALVLVFALVLGQPAVVSAAPPTPVENADVDENQRVNVADLMLVAAKARPRSDVNRDGKVNAADLGFVAAHYGPILRDKYKQPFAPDSIWNVPIGSGASYAPTQFVVSRDYTVIDVNYWTTTTLQDPRVEVIDDKVNWSGPRCASTQPSGLFTYFPRSLVVSDVAPSYQPNNAAAILQPDGRTIVQLNALARCQANGPVFGVPYNTVDIYGDGRKGAHGGSGLNSIGGTVRLGELLSSQPIRHALKVNIPCALYCSPASGPGGGPGWRWPATTSDEFCGTHACGYHGTLPYLHMGSLLALPSGLTEATIGAPGTTWAVGLETSVGRKLFHAFQDYGAYLVDDLVWNGSAYAIHAENGVNAEVQAATGIAVGGSTPNCSGVCAAFWRDWHRIWLNMKVITNNGPSTVGGGGTPRQPFATAIGN